ncbi:DUF2017 family protein [Crossiella cryophila]|uniref:Uncharacterized protein n=1 Tax=Crossiella cryophila TaxID=43355 RepID=A0A7W7CJF1_9PSEU|nr:DUF2017 family protein [Crossiella cryophila]MBB4682377.1 hypothetical protein [Crossiella cryophila]
MSVPAPTHECVTVTAEGGAAVLVLDEHAVVELGIGLNLLRWLIESREKRWTTAHRPLGRPRRSRLPARRGLHDLLPDGYDQEPAAGRFREHHEPWLRREILHAADRVDTGLVAGVPVRLSGEELSRWIAVLSQVRLCYLGHRRRSAASGRNGQIAAFCGHMQHLLVRAAFPAIDAAIEAAGHPVCLPADGPAPKS